MGVIGTETFSGVGMCRRCFSKSVEVSKVLLKRTPTQLLCASINDGKVEWNTTLCI